MQKFNISIFLKQNRLLILACICSAVLLLTHDEKSYILVTISFGLVTYFLTNHNLIQSIFLATLFTLPFEHGIRSWLIPIVTPSYPFLNAGYSVYFGISLKLILSATTIMLLVLKKPKPPKSAQYLYILLGVWWLIVLISAFNAPLQIPSLLVAIRLFVPSAVFVAASILCKEDSKFLTAIIIIIMSTLLMQSLVGAYQTINQYLPSFFLAETNPLYGFYTSDGERIFRASGLTGHPTFFGSLLSMFLPLSIGLFISKKYKAIIPNTLVPLLLLFSFISLIGTFSRSAWISVFLCGLVILFWHKNKNVVQMLTSYYLYGFLLVLGFIPLIFSRLASLSTFFTLGNGPGRLTLIESSVKIISEFPLLGIGPGLFTYGTNTNGLNTITAGFLYPVHNVFLLMASESGIPSAITMVVILFSILKKTKRHAQNEPLMGGLWLGCIAFLLNAQVHPLLGQDPTFDYFLLFLGILSTL